MNKGLVRSCKYSGEITLHGDKSLSHRAIIFASLANGKSNISNLLLSGDTTATLQAFKIMGIKVEIKNNEVVIHGNGLNGLVSPKKPLDCINSGTTARLLIGLLTGQDFESTVVGSEQLTKRPMDRVSIPLQELGCNIKLDGANLPAVIKPGKISKNTVYTNVPSAQVKSSLMLAAMYSDEPVVIIENNITRDHTERLMTYLGINLVRIGNSVTVPPVSEIKNFSETIPSDISSASFLLALGVLTESSIKLNNILINESRMGFVKVLQHMGAEISIENLRPQFGEQVGDIKVEKSPLSSIDINKEDIPSIIDELPIFALVASQAEGITTVNGVGELRLKESDRLEAMRELFSSIGMKLEIYEESFKIIGPQKIQSGKVNTHDDHRIAMTAVVAGLISNQEIELDNVGCIGDSYPSFFNDIESLKGDK